MSRVTLDPAGFYRRLPLLPHQLLDRRTRAEDVIVLCHLGVPRLAADAWTLSIEGLVARPIRLTFADLLSRPRVDVTTVHQCAGSPLDPTMPTRRICNVTWSGVALADLIAECAPTPEARFVWSYGADHGTFEGVRCDAYVKDLPLDRLANDVLLAYELNGQPLLPENGFPVRLVVPGYYGTNSVKWITRIELAGRRADGPFTTRWYNDAILDESGAETGETRPVWSIAPESVIVAPSPSSTSAVGDSLDIWGWAWADGGVAAVDISWDGGRHWNPATVEPAAGRVWQRYFLQWRPDAPGHYEIRARARGHDGQSQPESGARNAIHRLAVTVA